MLGVYYLGAERVVKMRNPWGKLEWKGDFCDGCPLWTVDYKKIVGYNESKDGIFCMKLADF